MSLRATGASTRSSRSKYNVVRFKNFERTRITRATFVANSEGLAIKSQPPSAKAW